MTRRAVLPGLLTAGIALALAGCLTDTAAPAGVRVVLFDAHDSVWVGQPGADTTVRVRLFDAEGNPVSGAGLLWVATGTGASVTGPAVSDHNGYAMASWHFGTDAGERQELRLSARHNGTLEELAVAGRAVPSVVAGLEVVSDTPRVVRLGETVDLGVTALDPYGNRFIPSGLEIATGDSTIILPVASGLSARARRGVTTIVASVQSHDIRFSVRVVQYVARIEPLADTLWFASLGADQVVEYVVRDDRDHVVRDTTATLTSLDTTRAQVVGDGVRSLAPGTTQLTLAIGGTQASLPIVVQQRVASLSWAYDTVTADALHDTLTRRAIARDSLGALISRPGLSYTVANAALATSLGRGVLVIQAPGVTTLTARDPVTGINAGTALVIQQRTATIDVAGRTFDALGDTQSMGATARDRLGSPIPGAMLVYAISDSAVARVSDQHLVRSIGPGEAEVLITDVGTGVIASARVTVRQVATRLSVASDSLRFDALGDSARAPYMAWDRLGFPIANAPVTYVSDDSAVVDLLASGALRSRGNGVTRVVVQSMDGVADSLVVLVAQRIAGLARAQDSLSFNALNAERPSGISAVDRMGSVVTNAMIQFAMVDQTVASVNAQGLVHALANGRTRVVAQVDSFAISVDVGVTQRPYRIVLAADTIRFDALGDTITVSGVVVDSLGSPVDSVRIGFEAGDSVVTTIDSLTLRASANGVTTASVVGGGAAAQVVVEVEQTVASLAVTSGEPVVRRSVGAAMPLVCEPRDRNGYLVARDAELVRSARGTVAGSSCSLAHVVRSGYDTLTFKAGGVETDVAVIVTTVGDSVGVVAAAGRLTTVERERYVGEDLAHPAIRALRPLVDQILAAYGNPTGNLDRARALRDWIARTAVHPSDVLHPAGSTANLSVLPAGAAWADVNAASMSKLDADRDVWGSIGADGYAMLDKLLGTLDPVSGARADDGLMVHEGGARYRIRDVTTYSYVQCSYQDIMLNALWAAAGLQGMLISTVGHDPAAVFVPELGRWVYQDPTFNEEYMLDGTGEPLSPADLLELTAAGQVSRLIATKGPGPHYDAAPYISEASYISTESPDGVVIMGSQLNARAVGIGGWPFREVQISVPRLAEVAPFNDPVRFVPVTRNEAFPTLGVVIEQVSADDSVQVVQKSSTYPNHDHFERRVNGGSWEVIGTTDVLPVGACRVEYRSVDALGNHSAIGVLDAWTPRADGFVASGTETGLRRQAGSCT